MARPINRTTNARDLLEIVRSQIEETRQFFRYDRSLILSKFRLQPDDDPRLVSLLGKLNQEDARVAQLRHLLVSKWLAMGEEEQRQEDGLPHNDDRRSRRHGHRRNFLTAIGLSTDSTFVSPGLKQGRRHRRIETATGKEGVSFALLPVFSRLSHLTREEEITLIKELQSGKYDDILQLAFDLSPLARHYQQWYNNEIDTILSIKLSGLFL